MTTNQATCFCKEKLDQNERLSELSHNVAVDAALRVHEGDALENLKCGKGHLVLVKDMHLGDYQHRAKKNTTKPQPPT